MSEAAPEAVRRPAAPAAGGNVLTRKIGPLPTWAWLTLGLAGGVGYIWWRNRQNASATAADNTATDTAAAGTESSGDDAGSIATLQSEIQQLQGEESTPPPDIGPPLPGIGGGKVKVLTVPKAETLAAYAKSRKWNSATLKAVEALNGLSASSKLKKGQKIVRPTGTTGEPT